MWQVVRNVRSAFGRPERPVELEVDRDEDVPAPRLPPGASRSAEAGQVFLLFPDEFPDDNPEPVPAPAARRSGSARTTRLTAYGAAGLLAGAGLVRLGVTLAAPRAPATMDQPGMAPPVSPPRRLDRAADTLALATGAFDLRFRLFQSHQMQCPDLARGLVIVEERWTQYNAARGAPGVAADAAHAALDRSLYAGVDAIERQFEESKCPRP